MGKDETKGTTVADDYQRTFSVYLSMKVNTSFLGFEAEIARSTDVELTLVTSYLLRLIELGSYSPYVLTGAKVAAQEGLAKRLSEAEDIINAEIGHVRKLKKSHPTNWKDIHYREMKQYLDKFKPTESSYV